MVIYEVYKKIKQVKGADGFGSSCGSEPDKSRAFEPDSMSRGGWISVCNKRLHFVDAVVYATAGHLGAELYTGDKGLDGLKGVTII